MRVLDLWQTLGRYYVRIFASRHSLQVEDDCEYVLMNLSSAIRLF